MRRLPAGAGGLATALTAGERAVIAALRAAYLAAGQPRGPMCANRECLHLATVRSFWPVLPGEEEPLYCRQDADRAKLVLETLGYKYREEALPTPAGPSRRIDLED